MPLPDATIVRPYSPPPQRRVRRRRHPNTVTPLNFLPPPPPLPTPATSVAVLSNLFFDTQEGVAALSTQQQAVRKKKVRKKKGKRERFRCHTLALLFPPLGGFFLDNLRISLLFLYPPPLKGTPLAPPQSKVILLDFLPPPFPRRQQPNRCRKDNERRSRNLTPPLPSTLPLSNIPALLLTIHANSPPPPANFLPPPRHREESLGRVFRSCIPAARGAFSFSFLCRVLEGTKVA